MKPEELKTKETNTWCPGCPNLIILQAFQEALSELVTENKIKFRNAVAMTGIGCHAKIYDYLNMNAFYGIHGRVLTTALGMKLGNPELKVIGFGGDGDTYDEGMAHFVHAGRYNADLTMIVHNNQVFSLTTGQATPTSEKGFKGASIPGGVNEKPINPILLALSSDTSFVARGYALEKDHLKNLIKQAIVHPGFALIDVLQPCIVYHNVIPYFQKNVYKLDEQHDAGDFNQALTRAQEWDYSFSQDKKVPIGIFYQKEKPTLESQWSQMKKPWYLVQRKKDLKNATKEFK
ncbi:MAG: thiamine pyrophosphate-dependent enzyme [Candidatus Nealsonbacteria bacterium]